MITVFLAAFGALVGLTMTQKIAPWTGRFYSLWDTGYAKIHSASPSVSSSQLVVSS